MAGLNLKVGINVLQATRELRSLAKSIGKIGVETKKANADAAKLGKSFGGLSAALSSTTGLLVQATGALAVFGTGAAARSALEFTADFQKNLADINTILGDGSVSIQQYEKQLLDLSTQSSKTLDDLSRGLYQTISAGIPAVDGASGAFAVLEASQKAAVAGLASTADAVDGTVSVLNAYGTSSIFATDVTDKLTTTVRLGRVRFDELAKGIGRVAPIAASAGVALDDVLAVFIQLTRQGIKPSEAITGLRNILKTLVRPTAKSSKTVEALNKELARLGREQIDIGSQALRRDGLIGVLRNLTQATGGSTEALAEIFPNVRALIPAIVSVGEGFEETVGFQKQLINSTGATAEAFKIVDATFTETFAKLQSNIGRIAALGFKDILEQINVKIKEFNEYLSDSRNVERITSAIGAAGAAFASFSSVVVDSLLAVSGAVSGLIELMTSLNEVLSLGTGNLKVTAALLAAVGVAAVKAKTGFSALFYVAGGLGTVGLGISALATKLTSVLGLFGAVATAAAALGLALKSMIDSLIEISSGVKSFGDLFSEAFAAIGRGDVVIGTIGLLSSAFLGIFDILSRIVALVLSLPVLITSMVASVVNAIIPIEGVVDSLLGAFGSLFNVVTGGFFGVINDVKKFRDEGKALQDSLKRTKIEAQAAAEALGFTGSDERNRFTSEIAAGGRVDLGEIIGGSQATEELNDINEAAKVFASTLDKDARGAVEKLAPAIEEFFTKFQEGAKKSQLSAKELFERLRSEISRSGTALSDVDQIGLAFSTSFAAFGGELESVNEQITKTQDELNALAAQRDEGAYVSGAIDAESISAADEQVNLRARELELELELLNAKREGLEGELNSLNLIDAANAKRREEIELALKKTRQKKEANKIEKALETLEQIRARNQQKLLDGEIKNFEIVKQRRELERSAIELKLQEISFERRLLEDRLKSSRIIDLTNNLTIKGIRDSYAELKKQSDDLYADQIANIQARFAKEEQISQIQSVIEEKRSALRDKKISDSEKKDLRSLEKIQKVLGQIKVAPVREIVENAAGFLSDLEGDALKVLDKSLTQDQKKLIQDLRDSLRDVDDSLRSTDKLFLDQLKRRIDVIKKAQIDLGKNLAESLVAGFSDAFKSSQFESLLKGFASRIGVDIGEAAILFDKILRQKLTDLGRAPKELTVGDIAEQLGNANDVEKVAKQIERIQKQLQLMKVSSLSTLDPQKIKQAAIQIERLSKQQEVLLKGAGLSPDEIEGVVASLNRSALDLSGVQGDIAINTLEGLKLAASLDDRQRELGFALSEAPGMFADGISSAIGSASLDFKDAIIGPITNVFSKTSGLLDTYSGIVNNFFEGVSLSLSEDINELKSQFPGMLGESVFGALGLALDGVVGLTGVITDSIVLGFQAGTSLFITAFGSVMSAVGTAVTAPMERLLGSLGSAVGVLADTPEEEDRRDRKEALELQRATLAELQRSGASNEQIAQEQARLAALLRQQRSDEPQTAAERLEEEINRSVEAALRIAEQLGPLVETFFAKVIDAIPVVVPALAKGLVEAIDVIADRLPEFIEVLTRELVQALPSIVGAIIRLIPSIIEALIRGLAQVFIGIGPILGEIFLTAGSVFVEALDRAFTEILRAIKNLGQDIMNGVVRGFVEVVRIIKEAFSSVFRGIGDLFSGIGTKEGLGKTVGLFGGSAAGALAAGALGLGPLGIIGAAALGGLGGLGLGSLFHEGGNIDGSHVNKSLANLYRSAGVQGFADGGMVGDTLRKRFRAAMSDDVPAILQTGEAVLNRSAVANIGGPNAVDAINSGAGIAPNLSVNVGINPNASGLGQAAAALLPFLIGSISVATPSQAVSGNLTGFRGVGGAPLIRRS